ncbi:hypothetical protein [Nocardioides astragali]|uniref:WD40 repeat domain-containing protein n=1 Tax=Nocardioides astragali TaxID=1776736 RepID=A0ABW2N4S4_9ACTN|nr:hypothetical protein [Nocardioides astragali]
MRNTAPHRIVGLVLTSTLALVAAAAPGAQAIGPVDRVTYRLSFVPAPPSPEDVVAVPGTRQVVVSGLAADPLAEGSVGHLYSMSTRTRSVTEIWPDSPWRTAWDKDTYADCPGPPDPAKASPHGINIETDQRGRSTLYVVNHGGREAIEVFRVGHAKTGQVLRLTWIGCAEMPEGTFPNGVAPLPRSAGFVVSNFLDPTSPNPFAGMFTGEKTGDVREWSRRRGWRTVPRSALGGANGIEVTPDGASVVVAAWGERKVYRIPLRRGFAGNAKVSVSVPLKPDNLRWTADGRLLLTGQDITEPQFIACQRGDIAECPAGIRVLRVDPDTMRVRTIFRSQTKRFRVPTVAAPVSGQIWIGSVKGERIAVLRAR